MSHDAADRPLDLSLLTGTCSSNNKTEETKDTEVAGSMIIHLLGCGIIGACHLNA